MSPFMARYRLYARRTDFSSTKRAPLTGSTSSPLSRNSRRALPSSARKKTEVYTLLYPNAVDLAAAIRDLFGSRVRVSLGANGANDTDQIQRGLSKFDLIDSRSDQLNLGLTGSGGGGSGGNGGGGSGGGRNNSSRRSSSGTSGGSGGRVGSPRKPPRATPARRTEASSMTCRPSNCSGYPAS